MYLFVFCVSSSWCCGLVCSVIVAFLGHTHLLLRVFAISEKGISPSYEAEFSSNIFVTLSHKTSLNGVPSIFVLLK